MILGSGGKLDWEKTINPLACGVKCVDKVTTVSPSYMEELTQQANGLEKLFQYERGKCRGIVNGIDTAVWDPYTDTYILNNFSVKDVDAGKQLNKKNYVTISDWIFRSRSLYSSEDWWERKRQNFLPQAISDAIYHMNGKMNF
jgi:starch synthase